MLRDVMLPQKKKRITPEDGAETETTNKRALFKRQDRADSYWNAAVRWYVSCKVASHQEKGARPKQAKSLRTVQETRAAANDGCRN